MNYMRHNISIVIVTVCRSSLIRAVKSVFDQTFKGKIQVLVGVDVDLYGLESNMKQYLESICPDHCTLTWLNIGYSTSQRHGGVHTCLFGGSLRTVLSFLADSTFVMYLDDDDWLAPIHCQSMLTTIGENHWAFSYCIYADGNTSQGICIDMIESVGVGKGIYRKMYGGFVRPSGLLFNKFKLLPILSLWSESPYKSGDGEDRLIFEAIKNLSHACSKQATVFYSLDSNDANHELRAKFMQQQGVSHAFTAKFESVR